MMTGGLSIMCQSLLLKPYKRRQHPEDCTKFSLCISKIINSKIINYTMAKLCALLLLAFVVGQTAASASDCQKCPADWQSFGDHCYKLNSRSAIYSDVEADCKAMGAYVAAPHSFEEVEFMIAIREYLWINCQDTDVEGDFVCCDGTTTDYRNWIAGEPNNYEGLEDCGVVYGNGKYNDISCTLHKTRGLCKRHVTTFDDRIQNKS
ncbi:lectin BRA-3-like [Patiria miniata]|uniref:C-type lectin domain-containing protein n=1 Tax=Patiria miniata TaxID=46514 RepID=A0A913ZA96_PATMI|nr:lectin BRA-3-like [Patiria miniata]